MTETDLFASLSDLVKQVDDFNGKWLEPPENVDNDDGTISFYAKEANLAWAVNSYLWRYSGQYTPADDGSWLNGKHNFIYPNIDEWDKKLKKAIEDDSFDNLSKDEVYSFIFGLHHRNRICDGLWASMFENGVMQKLLHRLLTLEETAK